MDKKRIDDLERARMSTLSGDYEAALIILDVLIKEFSNDVEALILKGNTLELKIADHGNQDSANSDVLNIARSCYEKVLLIDPDNSLALKDLADHCCMIGETEKALSLYKKLIDVLHHRQSLEEDVTEELDDAIAEYSAKTQL